MGAGGRWGEGVAGHRVASVKGFIIKYNTSATEYTESDRRLEAERENSWRTFHF